jgi:predicted CXXCH cytochrome family protein
VWRRYYVAAGTDWWTEHYPAEQMQRPTGPLCDGCHSTNYNVATKQVTEWNVGCEQCHGPGAAHVRQPYASNIVNPARLDFVRANDVCIQCHSQGRPQETPLNGVYYDWPVGFRAGNRLSEVWRLEEHKLGETTFTHWAEGSAHKNRMQGNDFVQSAMYTHGVTCFACHDTHGTEHGAELVRPASDVCLTCHGPQSPNGPRGTALQHSQHSAEKATCVDCHMHLACGQREVRRAERLHELPQGQGQRVGDGRPREMAQRVRVARRGVMAILRRCRRLACKLN